MVKRYREEGVAGIAEQSRRPRASPAPTAERIEAQGKQVRPRYPDWGARKPRQVLSREAVVLTASTIHRILRRQRLVRTGDRRRGRCSDGEDENRCAVPPSPQP